MQTDHLSKAFKQIGVDFHRVDAQPPRRARRDLFPFSIMGILRIISMMEYSKLTAGKSPSIYNPLCKSCYILAV